MIWRNKKSFLLNHSAETRASRQSGPAPALKIFLAFNSPKSTKSDTALRIRIGSETKEVLKGIPLPPRPLCIFSHGSKEPFILPFPITKVGFQNKFRNLTASIHPPGSQFQQGIFEVWLTLLNPCQVDGNTDARTINRQHTKRNRYWCRLRLHSYMTFRT